MPTETHTLERRQDGDAVEILVRDRSGAVVGYAYCNEDGLEESARREFARDFEV